MSDFDWDQKISLADELASCCSLCPHDCGVNRLIGEKGFCGAGPDLIISSIFPHHGEEPPLTGTHGSGTVFFSHCTLKCEFCQNFQISQGLIGDVYPQEAFAERMVWLAQSGCLNINWVTSTHFLPWTLRGLRIAAAHGLAIPLVYNCSGYESLAALDILKNVVDIYLPDMKYGTNIPASELSHAADYPQKNQSAIKKMFAQVGPLKTNEQGIAQQGLIIRHLVLPGELAGSFEILDFLKKTFDPDDITISLMAQYTPLYRANANPILGRRISRQEYEPVRKAFIKAGFGGYFQELEELNTSFTIDFSKRKSEALTGE